MNLDLERLMEVLAYDQDAGVFRWKVARGKRLAGDVAGTESTKGYWQIKVFQKVIEAHRLAWFFVHGVWPSHEVDHINCNKKDNRICNLRPANRSQNCANSHRRPWNQTGFKGVTRQGKKFSAQITLNTKVYHLGVFETAEDAHAAYVSAATAAHGDFARAA